MLENEDITKLMKKIEESSSKTIEEANAKQTEIIKQYIQKEINTVKNSFETKLESKSKEFEKKYNELKDKYERLEKIQRKNNLILFGIASTAENLLEHVLTLLNHHLGLEVATNEISNIYTVGKESDRKPIIITFLSYRRKQEIIKSAKGFKGTGISVAHDLSVEERRIQKNLRSHLKEARSRKQEAYIKNKKLVVNGVTYTAEELQSCGRETSTELEIQDDEDDLTEFTQETITLAENNSQKSEDQNDEQLNKIENKKGNEKEEFIENKSRATRRGNTKEVCQSKGSEAPKKQKSPVSKNLRSK